MTDTPSSDAWPPAGIRADESEATQAPARPEDLAALYRSHFGKIRGYFRRCGVNDAMAHDLAQETFVSALRGLAGFNGHSKLSTWVWTIARNALLMHLRGRTPDAVAAEAGDEPVDPDDLTSPALAHPTMVDDCVRRGFARFAAEHPERAQVIYLAVVEGWTREELAGFLGRTPHAATEYLSQCKARFRPFIEDCDGC